MSITTLAFIIFRLFVCFVFSFFSPFSGWQGSASEASVSDWCEAIDPLFEWCALISPEISCESWNNCIVRSFYFASLYCFCFCQHCLLHFTSLPLWLVVILENLCRFFKGVGIGVCFEGSQFILWMRYGFIDVVNNVILMVRLAPSNAFIAGLKSPIVVFGYHYNILFVWVIFFHFSPCTISCSCCSFSPTPQLCLLWSSFSQDYVDAQSVGITCSLE